MFTLNNLKEKAMSKKDSVSASYEKDSLHIDKKGGVTAQSERATVTRSPSNEGMSDTTKFALKAGGALIGAALGIPTIF
jgi:hypothetical protein